MDNNYIDEIVRDSIGEYEMAFNPDDWDVMESRLENDARVRRKLYTVKGVEVCLMLVTIWTMLQFVQIDNTANYEPQLIEKSTTAPPVDENKRVFPLDVQENKESRQLLTPKTVAPVDKNTMPSIGVPMANHFANPSTNSKMEMVNDHKETIEIQQVDASKVLDYSTMVNFKPAAPIASLTPKNIISSNDIPLMTLEPTTAQSSRKSKKNKYILGGFTGMDFVSITTPDSYSTLQKDASNSISAGLVLDVKLRNKLRVETGATWAARKHTEISLDAFYVAEKIGTLNTTSIEIPANVLYEIFEDDKNVVYTLAGISNHFAMTVQNSEVELLNMAGTNIPADPSLRMDGLLYSNGGEEIFKNHYASTNIGAGYERKMGSRLSLFAQATFKKGFGKLGEHDDNITTVSLCAGVKTML